MTAAKSDQAFVSRFSAAVKAILQDDQRDGPFVANGADEKQILALATEAAELIQKVGVSNISPVLSDFAKACKKLSNNEYTATNVAQAFQRAERKNTSVNPFSDLSL